MLRAVPLLLAAAAAADAQCSCCGIAVACPCLPICFCKCGQGPPPPAPPAPVPPPPPKPKQTYLCILYQGKQQCEAAPSSAGGKPKEECEKECAAPAPPPASTYLCIFYQGKQQCQAAPGGKPLAGCQAECSAPAPPTPPAPTPPSASYLCIFYQGKQQCQAAPGGKPLADCQAECSAPAPPTPPAPPAPAPTPPAQDAYLCILYQGKQQCYPAPPGTAGALPKAECEKQCAGAAADVAAECYACVMPSTGCVAVDCTQPGAYPSKAACAGACPVPAPPPPPAPPAPATRYHCDPATYACAAAAEGHSSLGKCRAACAAPAPVPPSPPTPSGRGWAYYNAAGPHKVTNQKIGTNVTHIWYPAGAAPASGWPVYQFVCGTGQEPTLYGASMKHIASHGIFVIVNFMDLLPVALTRTEESYQLVLSGEVAGVKVDAQKMAVGGHSGGGPDAAMHAGNHPGLHYIGQHAAAITAVNAPTAKGLARITGSVLQLCGTKDVMPFCGCGFATKSYYNKYPPTTRKMLVKSPDGHVDGTEGPTGDKYEGGFQTAFLSYVLLGDADARAALSEGGQRAGYTVTDNL